MNTAHASTVQCCAGQHPQRTWMDFESPDANSSGFFALKASAYTGPPPGDASRARAGRTMSRARPRSYRYTRPSPAWVERTSDNKTLTITHREHSRHKHTCGCNEGPPLIQNSPIPIAMDCLKVYQTCRWPQHAFTTIHQTQLSNTAQDSKQNN